MKSCRPLAHYRTQIAGWLNLVVVLAVAGAFVLYVRAEKEIDRANERRLSSFVLADQLKQSSTDLTQMVRGYAVTGDPTYKKHYQDILDIRDGKIRRPEGYVRSYWDLVLADANFQQERGGQGVPLLDLMRQTGFSEDEFRMLAKAKSSSDGLTAIEFAAIKLVETGGPQAQENRSKARLMLIDAPYLQAKANIMKPINVAYELMDKRTSEQVHAAERVAIAFRAIFILSIFAAILMLWRSYATMRKVLGGSAQAVHEQISRIGQGELYSAIPVAPGMADSVMAGLLSMQIDLRNSHFRQNAIFAASPDAILISNAQGLITQANQQVESLLGYAVDELIGLSIEALVPQKFRGAHPKLRDKFTDSPVGRRMGHGLAVKALRMDGSEVDVEVSLSRIETDQGFLFVSALHDISERKAAEANLHIAGAALEAQNNLLLGIIENIPGGVSVVDADLRLIAHNAMLAQLLDFPPALMAQPEVNLADFFRYNAQRGEYGPGDTEQQVADAVARARRFESHHFERVRPNGTTLEVRGVPLPAGGFVSIYIDISERKNAENQIRRLNQLYSALSHCNKAIVQCASEDDLFRQICHDQVVIGGMKMAWIGMVDVSSQRIRPVASYGAAQEYLDGLQISIDGNDPLGQGPTGTAVREDQPYWCQDFLNEPRTTPWQIQASRFGLAAAASLPLHCSGNVVGTLNLYSAKENAFDADTRKLLIEMAMDISFALDNFARDEVRKTAQASLQASEKRLNEAQRIAKLGSWTLNLESGELHWSDEIFRLFEIDSDQFGATYEAFINAIHPQDRDAVNRAYTESLANRQPYAIVHRLRMPDGRIKWVQEECLTEFDETGKALLSQGTALDITARFLAEEQMRIAATAFESQEAMMVTDIKGVILQVNRAFTATTGYAAHEAIGQTPRLLRSERHDDAFYTEMWQTLLRRETWQGEVWDRRKNGEVYAKWLTISAVKDGAGTVTHYVGTHFDISERKKAEARIEQLAFFDQLTGLPNRTLLLDRLKLIKTVSARSGSFGALLMLDLDRFKMLNDTLGHDMGDELLKQVAQRLNTCVRACDTVARLGGDEFVVVLANLGVDRVFAATQAKSIAEKIMAVLNQPYVLGAVAYHSTQSIGVVMFGGNLASIVDLMKQADLAMYKAKAAGRNSICFFDPAMEEAVKERALLERDLRQALKTKQFLLHYQAQITGDKLLTGAEVLVRWQHPQRGMVSPDDFIPLAEETGLILPLGHWVLEAACTQLALWATQAGKAHLTLAVNVSAQQFREPNFVALVQAVITQTGAEPKRLKLELTESLLVDNVEDIIAKMVALKSIGIGFSLDDFGTGYSCLSYLKRLPLDQLKIDKSFINDVLTDPNDAAIARTVVALGQSLGLGVIAEGVETAAQLDFLAASGCHAYQGYFFSRPLPLEGFEEFARGR